MVILDLLVCGWCWCELVHPVSNLQQTDLATPFCWFDAFTLFPMGTVPYKGVGCCLGLEGSGVSLREEGEGGPGPQTRSEISSLTQQGRRQHGAGGRRKEEPSVTKRTQRAQSEHR